VHDEAGRLRFVGSVGTGWDAATARDLHKRLSRLHADAPPFDDAAAPQRGRWTRRPAGSERWVRPRLVVEVAFGDWTPAGQIRHASFVARREDKPARAITREAAVDPPAAARGTTRATRAASAARSGPPAAAAGAPAGVKVTNPQRVIDPQSGLTKLDLVRYYDSVAERILPHLRGRPVSLVRGPQGIGGQLFFQKHGEKIGIPGIKELDPALWPGHDALLEIDSREALLGAAQMNVIEFHTWNATSRRIDRPDRIVFDLDPGEGVAWKRMQEAAQLVRALLDELALPAWLKTSGGKGLHVVVPIAPRWSTDAVKDLSQAIVVHLARTPPDRFVAKSGAANRVGRIFVDYLRNGFGATTAVAFSARARPGLGVSIPVAWEQLPELKSGAQWTVATAREHLSFEREDPWAGYWSARTSIVKAARTLGLKLPAAGGAGR
jgi:bifunctional non-homologous end joining protein LigD